MNLRKRFKFQSVKRFWSIAKLYWFGNEQQGALALLVFLGVLLFANTQLKVVLNTVQGNLITSLAAKNSPGFWQGILLVLAGIMIFGLFNSGYGYVRETLGIYWRRWLTNFFLDKYFSDRSFYDLTYLYKDIDNPDQRISEDIANFCQQCLQFLVNIVESIFVVGTFSIILWSISQSLVFALVIYSILAYALTIGFYGKKLTNLNYEQLKKEANFRFGLVRIRENAESIAFYNGIIQEDNKIKLIFQEVFQNFQKLILWSEVYLNIFKYQFSYLPVIIPAIILGNQVLSGEILVGKVVEAGGAFGQVAFSVNVIMYQFEKFTKFAASINRLYLLNHSLKNRHILVEPQEVIKIIPSNKIAVENLTLQTPNYEKTLFRNLSITLATGQGLLIMGESGCGKSSLLRAVAGLWNSGTGVIFRPELSEMLFLPQRPYMMLGSLRDQLFYPFGNSHLTDHQLHEILQKVNLLDLDMRFGGFDVEQDWSEVLSLGEQQRLAFARFLVSKPKYVILDEATSALDEQNEASLYDLLLQSGTTFISVGHRPTLKRFHNLVIFITADGVNDTK
ncbi:ABC transporter ATP-binding protein/permease [Anabaena sp. FACHB-1237]|uniref:ABC transporter ATP-binding protein/permease n=1 Tax=Anabaena sp. FACHB-1237 TaxID=2692769 RepID=UPI0016809BE6|nr:ABC transporter ATP-binding protein/permease [Anabaena sp. FACHB-1237]MBD2136139.1 ABC transporter ATP-binding protein/permease [Anabaena sp. FACHB-1237]